MLTYICTQCGSQITVEDQTRIGTCPVCGALFVLPNQFPQKQNLYRLAGEARKAGDFDRALSYYSRILKVDATEAEAHWGYLLSKYGVEVSQDAATLNQIFFHRMEHGSFLEDPSYEKMITYCPAEARYYYEGLSRRIEERHSKMLELSRKMGVYDIYVNCIEEPGTEGYMLANQVGKALDDAGYRVFLPATMLGSLSPEEKNLREMAAAEKATAMLVVVTPGTPVDNRRFQAVWKRFFAYRRQDAGRKMLSVYQGLRPEQLPLELQSLQSLECSGRDFRETVVAEINRMFGRQTRESGLTRKILETLHKGEALLKRRDFSGAAEQFRRVRKLDAEEAGAHWGLVLAATENLKKPKLSQELDTDYQRALQFAQPEQRDRFRQSMSELMTEPAWKALCDCTDSLRLTDVSHEQKVIEAVERVRLYMPKEDERLAQIDDYYKRKELQQEISEVLEGYNRRDTALEPLFAEQVKAENEVKGTGGFKSSFLNIAPMLSYILTASLIFLLAAQVVMTLHFSYTLDYTGSVYKFARLLFIVGVLLLAGCLVLFASGEEKRIILTLIALASAVGIIYAYRHHTKQTCLYMILVPALALLILRLFTVISLHTIQKSVDRLRAAKERLESVDGQIRAAYQDRIRELYLKYGMEPREAPDYQLSHSEGFSDKIEVPKNIKPAAYLARTVVLYAAVIAGVTLISNFIYARGWKDIVSMAPSGYHVAALKSNGTVVANGLSDQGQCDVGRWRNVVQLVTGRKFTAGLKEDGTVLVAGGSGHEFDSVSEWTDIVSLAASNDHLVGLKKDGTCVAAGNNDTGACNVQDFRNVVQVNAISGSDCSITVVVTKDGTLRCTGYGGWGSISDWMQKKTGSGEGQSRVARLYGRHAALIAVTDSEESLSIGSDYYHQLSQTEDWDFTEIEDVWVCNSTLGLKKDGTVLYAGETANFASHVADWKDITAISGCVDHALGLCADGTVVAAGTNHVGQLETDNWEDIAQIYTGDLTSFGVKSDGTAVAAGYGLGGMTYVAPKTPLGLLEFWLSAFHW